MIKTDIKPTIPKNKRSGLKAAAAVAEEKSKKEVKPFVKSNEESRDDVESVKRSSGYRS